MILVTGAGGKTGGVLIEMLSKVESVCAFVHRQSSVTVVKSLGADKVIVGELLDESALELALEGARAVYHICPNMSPDEILIGKQIIRQALKTGVEHFIYHSALHPQTEKMAHHWGKTSRGGTDPGIRPVFHHPAAGTLYAESAWQLEENS